MLEPGKASRADDVSGRALVQRLVGTKMLDTDEKDEFERPGTSDGNRCFFGRAGPDSSAVCQLWPAAACGAQWCSFAVGLVGVGNTLRNTKSYVEYVQYMCIVLYSILCVRYGEIPDVGRQSLISTTCPRGYRRGYTGNYKALGSKPSSRKHSRWSR